MELLKVAVIDDEKNDIEIINEKIQSISKKKNIPFSCSSFLSPGSLPERSFDIYVIDIDMPEISGFELSRKLSASYPSSKMIFCTNHNDLVFSTFEINTFYFVRKDHLEEDLRKAFEKYFRTCYRGHFQINDNRQIPLTKISFLEVSGNNLTITLQDGKEIETRKTLKAALEQVPSDQFIQISKYCVVNLGYVQDVRGINCILSNGKKLQISRSRKKEVLEKFDQFLASRL